MRVPIIKRYVAVGKVATDGNILVPVNELQVAFGLGVGIIYSVDAAGGGPTNVVQFTYDPMDLDWYQPVTISQAAFVLSVTDPSLPARGGLAVGDAVRIQGTGLAGVDGEWPVASVPSPTSYTLTSSVSQAITAALNGRSAIYRLFSSLINGGAFRRIGNLAPGLAAQTATGILNSGPVTAVALNVAAITAGSIYLQVVQGLGR